MKWILVFLFFTWQTTFSQQIKGIVINAISKQSIQGASVYISNSFKGTVTDAYGQFLLTNLPTGNITLVVSCVGFETYNRIIEVTPLTNVVLNISLNQKVTELSEVNVIPYEKNGFEKWGTFFLENFIGKMDKANDCIIKNLDALKFYHNKKTNTLLVKSTEPLKIENKSLGYKLTYDLQEFNYDFRNGILFYSGFQFFEEMDTKRKGKMNRWILKRRETYYGSMMHFMRSLYNNSLDEDGFVAMIIIKTKNYEKERVKEMIRKNLITKNRIIIGNKIAISDDMLLNPTDSSAYYNKIMNQPNEFNYLINKPLKADSIVKLINMDQKELSFNDYLQVTYRNKLEPEKYIQQNYKHSISQVPQQITSTITLLGEKRVIIYKNGNYFNPIEVLSSGWWAWSEKIATLLPIEYIPN